MHGTLEKEACRPPAPSRRAQQKRFDTFRRIYNEERPHEAIANATPSMLYRSSPRTYPARLPELVYPDHWQVRMVRQKGAIKWRGDHLFISEVLAGEPIGLEERPRMGPLLRSRSARNSQSGRPIPTSGSATAARRAALRNGSARRARELRMCYPSSRSKMLPIHPAVHHKGATRGRGDEKASP